VDVQLISEVRGKFNEQLAGLPLADVALALSGFASSFAPTAQPQVTLITDSLLDQVDANRQEKIILAGTANLARREEDFPGSISPVLEAIEEQVVLLKLITEMQAEQHGVSLRIGRENSHEGLNNASVVVSGYENQGSEIAKLGVIGPTRMDYSSNISAVRAVARYLTKALGN
jgi:heat-inducible transcriptional repressor